MLGRSLPIHILGGLQKFPKEFLNVTVDLLDWRSGVRLGSLFALSKISTSRQLSPYRNVTLSVSKDLSVGSR